MKEKVINYVSRKNIVLIIISIILFCIILINVLNGNIQSFDSKIYSFISFFRSNFMDIFFRIITRFGDEEVLILIAIACLIFIKNRKIGLSIVINLASIGLINHILKEIIQRPRPPMELRMVQESSFSFPSGHAMASLAFYGLIIYYILRYIKHKKWRNISCIILSVLILLIGISRIYLGVHYASDILAGFLGSTIYLTLVITIGSAFGIGFYKIKRFFKKKKAKSNENNIDTKNNK